jgi:hypothetical protein
MLVAQARLIRAALDRMGHHGPQSVQVTTQAEHRWDDRVQQQLAHLVGVLHELVPPPRDRPDHLELARRHARLRRGRGGHPRRGVSVDLSTFPSEPWDLHGHGLVTVGLLPIGELTAPTGTRLVTLRGRAIVGAVLLRYTEPSPLSYHEIMAAVVVRRGRRLFVHIPDIWVDSAASRAGGRSLWAIPKELAEFEDRGLTVTGIAGARLRHIRGSLKVPAVFRVAQERDGRTLLTPVRGNATLSPARVGWTFDPAGPLARLREFRPLAHLVIRRFHLVFGPAER